ncbi:Atonal 8 [Cichlidogyrus casuarinus]|uniref:Atonal 8 n=1 Tax=Cichlidogyrus casuarinus TaxID=1844966 RepID=A0ABD2Q532_9PLAT
MDDLQKLKLPAISGTPILSQSLSALATGFASTLQTPASPTVDSQQLMIHQMNAWIQGVQAALSLMPTLMGKMQPQLPLVLNPLPSLMPPLNPTLLQSLIPAQTQLKTSTLVLNGPLNLQTNANPSQPNTRGNSGGSSLAPDSTSAGEESDDSSKSPMKKSAKTGAPLTTARRMKANARERNRVHTISAAFEKLRTLVPSSHSKMSKLAILRIASAYIETLAAFLNEEQEEATETKTKEEPEDLSLKREAAPDKEEDAVPIKVPRLMPDMSLDQCRFRLLNTINNEIRSIRRTGYMICDPSVNAV